MVLADTVFGLNIQLVVIILLLLIIILFIGLIVTFNKMQTLARKYYTLTSGKNAKDLESIMLTRFKEMDKVKSRMKRFTEDHKGFKGHLDTCYNKMGLVKYDAFDNMAGELSYSLALLNADNSGFVVTSMHSKQGCYSYAKEIIKGESYLALSKEEKAAIGKALTVDEEIERMKNEVEEEDVM